MVKRGQRCAQILPKTYPKRFRVGVRNTIRKYTEIPQSVSKKWIFDLNNFDIEDYRLTSDTKLFLTNSPYKKSHRVTFVSQDPCAGIWYTNPSIANLYYQ